MVLNLQEMLERQLEYERVRLEAESRKACLESQEKVGDKNVLTVTFLILLQCMLSDVFILHVFIYRRDFVPS